MWSTRVLSRARFNIGTASSSTVPFGAAAAGGLNGGTTNNVDIFALCLPGYVYNYSSSECDPCLPGSYNLNAGEVGCRLCPLGRYNPNPGAGNLTQCLLCPAGSAISLVF